MYIHDQVSNFIVFVRGQPAEKLLDHSRMGPRGGWCRCAVGEFLPITRFPTQDSMQEFLFQLQEDLPDTFYAVNNGHSASSLQTYGELQDTIDEEVGA